MTITNDKDCRKYQDRFNELIAMIILPDNLKAEKEELSAALRAYHTQQLQLSKSKKK